MAKSDDQPNPHPVDAKSIFANALELPDAERAAYLDAACGGDAALRADVNDLLEVHGRAGGFLAGDPGSPETATASHRDGSPGAEEPTAGWVTGGSGQSADAGTVLAGRYKLIEEIGAGGMGSVWLAEQTEPVKRTVAVKLIKAGMDSKAVVARFEAERQALALMDHPNIAKVLDAGATESGRPFFVMELVKGVPITQFCDERKLTTRQRLELFVPVCQAIQHAHQKGVIHRDIKPSNVLVAVYDDKPLPKVIDFGIAKAVGEPLTDKSLNTGLGTVVGTPAYMAPEQATLNQLDIDTRADVYALGAVLYELLTGAPPFDAAHLRKAGLLEMLRVVREEEPPKPSTRLSGSAELPAVASARGTEPKALAGLLRSELDWVVMKALEKDRARRYETAAGFAADVQRYLTGQAVEAVPPGAYYRFRKFVRRHRSAVAVAVALTLTVAAGVTAAVLIQLRAERKRAETAREAAEKYSQFVRFMQTLLEAADPDGSTDPNFTVLQMLDEQAKKLDGGLPGQPDAEADLRITIGRTYYNLNRPDQAVAQFERALELRRDILGEESPAVAEAMTDLAAALLETPLGREFTWEEGLARTDRARLLSGDAVTILRSAGPDSREALARALIHHGIALRNLAARQGRNGQEAVPVLTEGLTTASTRRLVALAHEMIAIWHREHGDWKKAAEHARQAVAARVADRGEGHVTTAQARLQLGRCLLDGREYPAAEVELRRAHEVLRKVFASRANSQTSDALRMLAFVLACQFKDAEVETVLRDCPPDWKATEFQFEGAEMVTFWWGQGCLLRGDPVSAERHYRQTRTRATTVPIGFAKVVATESTFMIAVCLSLQGRHADARGELEAAGLLAAARRTAANQPHPPDQPPPPEGLFDLDPREFLAQVLLVGGHGHPADLQLADRLFEELLQGRLEDATRVNRRFHQLLVWHLQRRHADVVAGMPEVIAALDPWGFVQRREADSVLAESQAALGRAAGDMEVWRKVAGVWRKAAERCEKELPAGHPEIVTRRVRLGEALVRAKQPKEAITELETAFKILTGHPQAKAGDPDLARRTGEVLDLLIAAHLTNGNEAEAKSRQAERSKYPREEPPPPRQK